MSAIKTEPEEYDHATDIDDNNLEFQPMSPDNLNDDDEIASGAPAPHNLSILETLLKRGTTADSDSNMRSLSPIFINMKEEVEPASDHEDNEDHLNVAELYSGHDISNDIVIGPTVVQSTQEPTIMEYENCIICGCALKSDVVTVSVRGIKTLISVSQRRQDNKFTSVTDEKIQLHRKCRVYYINERCIQSDIRKSSRGAENSTETFDYQQQCLFCGKDASEMFILNEARKTYGRRKIVCRVLRKETADNIYVTSLDDNHDLSKEVRSRVQDKDLVKLNARYHKQCYVNFLNPKIPRRSKKGRPVSEELETTMQLVYDYIDSNMHDSQFTVEDLRQAINVPLPDIKTLKRKLLEHYGVNMLVIESNRKPTVLLFVTTSKQSLSEQWYTNRQTDKNAERLRIVRTAANIVLEDIRSIPFETLFYPTPASFLENVEEQIPNTLLTFMKTIISKYKKDPESLKSTTVALSHAIMAAARPRSFKSPLLLGISSLIHQKYASKTLIDLLSSIGFCASYKDVAKFEVSALFHPQPETESEFKQFVFDNADFKTQNIDIHSMVGIQCNTPKDTKQDQPIMKLKTVPQAAVVAKYDIPLQHFLNSSVIGLKNIAIHNHVDDSNILPTLGDVLWLYGKSENLQNTPEWNAFMSNITQEKEYSVSEIQSLPFIHNDHTSNYDTIYTTLKEAQSKSKDVCIVTFNQPLYDKAQEIIHASSEFDNVILRLGGFHLLVSFLGAIGYIMSGSGLKELWCTVYAAVPTEKMMSGHSYARALRAHFLTRAAIFNLFVKHIDITYKEKLDIESILDKYLNENFPRSSQSYIDNSSVKRLQEQLNATLNLLSQRGPTAKLWVEYFKMTTLVTQFIEAEKSGNWELHLSTIKKMLPYFYASGHFAYAKSCTMYLQDMSTLSSKMKSEDYEKFCTKGFFTIRRNDKFWAGVWTDETLEQTLKRSVRSSGVLTRGRGTDNVLAKWILSAPIMSTICEKVEEYCGVSYSLTIQDADGSDARIKRDSEDISKFSDWLIRHNPFSTTENIVSLSTGVVGDKDINCHEARNVGSKMMLEKVGQMFRDVTYQRKDCVLPLSSIKSYVEVDDAKIPIEPDMILKRICFAKKNKEQLKCYFQHELTPYPLSLFDENGMRKTNKSILYELCKPIDEFCPKQESVLYIIDGEFLLHGIVWKEGMTISEIGEMFIDNVKKRFGKAAVIFEGDEENEINTKIAERNRRTKGQCAQDIPFEKSTQITTTQEKFLSNQYNKDRLIKYLITEFQNSDISAKQCAGNADTVIITTAFENANNYDEIYIVGENIDLLVIMCGSSNKRNVYFMRPGQFNVRSEYYATNCFDNNIMRDHIFFVHAFSGCDTTSAIFRQGKKKIANLVKTESEVQALISIFKYVHADPDTIADAGEKFLRRLYGEKHNDLNVIRFNHFVKSMTKSRFDLACLPPTVEAARQHSYRVYHQIQSWLGNIKAPTEWGWKFVNNHLEPIMTSLEAAPMEVLNMISCKCKNTCEFNCVCKDAGLNCSILCVNCNGRVCHGTDINDDCQENNDNIVLTGCDMFGNPLNLQFDEEDNLDSDRGIYIIIVDPDNNFNIETLGSESDPEVVKRPKLSRDAKNKENYDMTSKYSRLRPRLKRNQEPQFFENQDTMTPASYESSSCVGSTYSEDLH